MTRRSRTSHPFALSNLLALSLFALLVLVAQAATIQPATAQGVLTLLNKRSDLGATMSAAEAHKKALNGELVLIDIRTPGEWQETGIASSALPITMHQPTAKFFHQVHAAQGYDLNKPVAIICAVGVRTTYMQEQMKRVGFLNVINVAEGMIGGRHGKGWLKEGLPISKWSPDTPAKPLPKTTLPRGSFAQ